MAEILLIFSAVGKSAQGFFFIHPMEHFPTIALLTLKLMHYCSTQCIDQKLLLFLMLGAHGRPNLL